MTKDEIIKEWCAELRSGKWEQLIWRLGDANSTKRCCMGVLCELAIRHEVIEQPTKDRRDGHTLIYEGEDKYLPYPVKKWAHLRDIRGGFMDGSLTSMNDSRKSFAEIAAFIESKPPYLFIEEEGV